MAAPKDSTAQMGSGGIKVGSHVSLTPRQRQVTELMASGMTDCEIARELNISPRTVRMHSEALRHKLGVEKRRHIVPALRKLDSGYP